jgi:hypothetical protein
LSRSCANSGLPGLLQSVVFSAGSDVGRAHHADTNTMEHFNAISSWGIDAKGEVSHVYA